MLQSAALNDNDAVGQILIFITKISWNFWQSQILVKCFSSNRALSQAQAGCWQKMNVHIKTFWLSKTDTFFLFKVLNLPC